MWKGFDGLRVIIFFSVIQASFTSSVGRVLCLVRLEVKECLTEQGSRNPTWGQDPTHSGTCLCLLLRPQKGASRAHPDPSLDADVILVASALVLAVAWGLRGCAC